MPIALVDCNNFYVSCERLFNPRLEGMPVVVLSNNDGCAVARSNEVKVLGVKMAEPWFKIEKFAKQHGITALSSNYALYGDISARVMSTLSTFSPARRFTQLTNAFSILTASIQTPLYPMVRKYGTPSNKTSGFRSV